MKDGKHVVLCVDDDQDFLLGLQVILEDNGYAMVQAQDGKEALSVFQANQPDLVLVDLMMEEVDAGTNFVKELRASGSTVPVYMISSAGDQLSVSTDTSETCPNDRA